MKQSVFLVGCGSDNLCFDPASQDLCSDNPVIVYEYVPCPAPAPAPAAPASRGGWGGACSPGSSVFAYNRSRCPEIMSAVEAALRPERDGMPRRPPSPLEVLTRAPQTGERVKKREIQTLRRRISDLEALAKTERAHAAEERVLLEREAASLRERIRVLEAALLRTAPASGWRPVPWSPGAALRVAAPPLPSRAPPVASAPSPQPAVSAAASAALVALPWVGAGLFVGLASRYLVPAGSGALKFAGYSSAAALVLFGVGMAVSGLLAPGTRAAA